MPSFENIQSAQDNVKQTFAEFYELFAHTFFKQAARKLKSIPEDDAKKLFNDLWQQMEEKTSSAKTRQELDHYFNALKSDTLALKKHGINAPDSTNPLAKSCEEMKIRLSWLHRSDLTDLFSHLIAIYHWLAVQRLFFRQLNDYQSMLIELTKANDALQQKHNLIDIVCQPFLQAIKKRGHLAAQKPWVMFDHHPLVINNKDSKQVIDEIEYKLSKLPSNKHIDRVFEQAQGGQINDDIVLMAQARAKFFLAVTEDVKALSALCLSEYKDRPCHQLTSASAVPSLQHKTMTENMSEVAFGRIDINKDIMALSAICKNKDDKNTAKKIEGWLDVSKKLIACREEYAQGYVDQHAASARTFKNLFDNIQQEKIRYQHLQQKINNAEKMFNDSIEYFQLLSKKCTLISNMQPKISLGNLLDDNKGKMLIIGALVAAAVIAVGVVLALNVFAIAAIGFGGLVLGASLGLLGGMAVEKMPKPNDLTNKEVESLLGYDTIAKREEQKKQIIYVAASPELVWEKSKPVQEQTVAESVVMLFPKVGKDEQASAVPPEKDEKRLAARQV